jgi:Xaa-Pro aminopeptidase
VLFGTSPDLDDLIWTGPQPSLGDLAADALVENHKPFGSLDYELGRIQGRGIALHYLPVARHQQALRLAAVLNLPVERAKKGASEALIRAVVAQRSVKSTAEIREIEDALAVSAGMFHAAIRTAKPGVREAEVAAAMQAVALAGERAQAFLPIVSRRGEVLHNNYYGNVLADGDLLLVDAGAESARFYASDLTRTFPVSGNFSERQRAIYQIVLNAHDAVAAQAAPGKMYLEMHRLAARTIAAGLRDLGLLTGDLDTLVREGAHALFFPHGVGHMLGLDVHDMEDLGEQFVGYDETVARSEQFGLAYLRMARRLAPGFVVTVEPGVYFVPALIDRWKADQKFTAFVNYAEVDRWRDFGGVRLEDDLLVTDTGARVLGPGVPITVADVEAAMGKMPC